MAIRYKDSNGNWITGQKAIETQLIDAQGNFVATNVEDALQEIKVEVDQDLAQLKGEVQGQTEVIGSLSQDMTEAKEAIEWLKVNGGGGGGGTAIPTITSTLEDCAIEKGQDLTIPLFFSSSNMGNGTAYVLVNNIEVDTFGVKQGNNTLKLKAEYLIDVENFVSLYVKDRAGIVSNQLSWKIVSGGIELTSTFDYEVDYGITDDIRLTYDIETGINEEIKLYLNINGVETEHVSQNGDNFIDLKASDLGLGTHPVTMFAKVGKYVSKELRFNIVVVSTTDLYLSSTFVNNSEHKYGVPISVNYRLSKLSTEEFNVFLKIDDEVIKTQRLTVGSYYWTVAGLTEGSHKLTIQAVSLDYSENVSLDLNLTIIKGEYEIVEDYKLGLICDLNAVGKSNNDDGANIWLDESGNGNNGILVNFNYGTNGFINDELVCDNDAYVRIPFSPWKENALTGSTIDLIYTPINSGDEECRVIDYTQVIDDLSTEEIKPFKGIFADITKTIPSSASSGSSAGRVNLDENLGEIHLTWVLDRTEKFMKVYVDGVLSRIMFLSDSGVGVNKFYEDFSLEEDIYLNSTKGLRCGTNNIRRFRIYDHALTSDEVLQNHIANIKDLELQEEMYKFNYENTTLPKMYLIGDTTNMTHEQSVPMKINYVSPNEEKYGMSFSTGIQNNQVLIQGTSSLQYVRKNYTIYLKDEYGADMMYNPYGVGNKADHVFCLKADKHFKI